VPHTKQHLQEGEGHRNGAAAQTEPVLGFPSVCRIQCTGGSHLQEGMVSPEGDTALGPNTSRDFSRPRRTKNSDTTECHHLASPPTSMSHHDLEVTIISRFVTLTYDLDNGDTRHRRDSEQQPRSHAGGTHLHRREAVIDRT
jgi:hypothetical protein